MSEHHTESIVCANPEVTDAVEKALFNLWSVVNDLSRLKPEKPRFFRVTVFGSARIEPGQPIYEDVKRLAAELSSRGCDIVTGGGPGLMQAANEGENIGDPENLTRSYGIRIELPFEQGANPFVEKVYTHRTFYSRLHQFVRLSSAFIVVGGGIGSTLETMMIWQLLQVRQVRDVPLILVGPMWKGLVEWAKEHMLGGEIQLASPGDFDIPICVDTVDEAIALLEPHIASFKAP
ncbi:MAG: LOG family protein [Proteobacteria bacterium]|jgi:uncharacterized protein (TIGR00730 family)|nr:LOG family protein [Pseudomonadota bacterium]